MSKLYNKTKPSAREVVQSMTPEQRKKAIKMLQDNKKAREMKSWKKKMKRKGGYA